MDPIIEESVADLYDMLKKRGRETEVDLMEDGGLNKGNLESFVSKGMNVGEFSSPLMKGPNGKFKPGNGDIAKAAKELRAFLDELSASYRSDDGRLL
jgi:hypothetical protein